VHCMRLTVTRLFNLPNPSESERFSTTEELMSRSIDAKMDRAAEREATRRDACRELLHVSPREVERHEALQLTEPFGE
jgi:hypothetical protein